jgi:hypothetical protein
MKAYLANIEDSPRSTLVSALESIGLILNGKSPDGRFMEFIDQAGRVRAKLHPPDKVTKYHHLHLYSRKGRPLTRSLLDTTADSPAAHIRIGQQ